MDFSFRTAAALLLLVTAASCAPAAFNLQDACADVQNSSLELNQVARTASITARNGSKDVTDFASLAWMEAKDMCDPGTLKRDSATCVGKILDVLTSYKSAVERVSGFTSCSARVRVVEPAIQRLQRDISTCVKSRGGSVYEKHNSIEEIHRIPGWQEALLCQYTMDRLFSFSILTARVFAVGDPSEHTGGSAHTCM